MPTEDSLLRLFILFATRFRARQKMLYINKGKNWKTTSKPAKLSVGFKMFQNNNHIFPFFSLSSFERAQATKTEREKVVEKNERRKLDSINKKIYHLKNIYQCGRASFVDGKIRLKSRHMSLRNFISGNLYDRSPIVGCHSYIYSVFATKSNSVDKTKQQQKGTPNNLISVLSEILQTSTRCHYILGQK